DPRQQRRMLGIDELKAKCAPHVDLGRVLVHVAGIDANETNPDAGQEEKRKKPNTPPQAFGPFRRRPPLNDADVQCTHPACAPQQGFNQESGLSWSPRFTPYVKAATPHEEDRTKAGHWL